MQDINELLDKSLWYYISYKEYQDFLILIIEKSLNNWNLIYLDRIAISSESQAIDDLADWGEYDNDSMENPDIRFRPHEKGNIDVPAEFSSMPKDLIFPSIEQHNPKMTRVDYDLNCFIPIRTVNGNLGAIIEEFQMIIKKG